MPETPQEEAVESQAAIFLDKTLLAKVLTSYGHIYEHFDIKQNIIVDNISYDEDIEVVTAFIHFIKETEH